MGRRCRAAPLTGADVCLAHRHHRLAGISVTLAELSRLAETFDEQSRMEGAAYSAIDFIIWCAPELGQQR